MGWFCLTCFPHTAHKYLTTQRWLPPCTGETLFKASIWAFAESKTMDSFQFSSACRRWRLSMPSSPTQMSQYKWIIHRSMTWVSPLLRSATSMRKWLSRTGLMLRTGTKTRWGEEGTRKGVEECTFPSYCLLHAVFFSRQYDSMSQEVNVNTQALEEAKGELTDLRRQLQSLEIEHQTLQKMVSRSSLFLSHLRKVLIFSWNTNELWEIKGKGDESSQA